MVEGNVIRYFGDALHLISIVGLMLYIWRKRSCTGISAKTQILLVIVFTARYLDMFTYFISAYNEIFKIIYIATTFITVLSIFHFRHTYNSEHDTFRSSVLVVIAAVIACFHHYEFSFVEVSWAFSEYLEALAIIPQLYLISKAGKPEKIIIWYIFGLAMYRTLYIFNWIYRMKYENHTDKISFLSGSIQSIIYYDYLLELLTQWVFSKCKKSNSNEVKYPVYILNCEPPPVTLNSEKAIEAEKIDCSYIRMP